MRKVVITLLLSILVLPIIVNAKEYCKVVSGNGKDIGSEISCGDEHFYIVDSNKEEIKMLAKYNLNVGIIIHKEKIKKEANDTRSKEQYCMDLASSKGGFYKNDRFYSSNDHCFFETRIETDRVLQSKEAISAHWDENDNYLYPQVGDVYYSYNELFYFNNYSSENNESYFILDKNIENTKFIDYNFDFNKLDDNSPIINYDIAGRPYGVINALYHYKKELNNMNYDINTISLLSISELDEVVNKISNKRLPLNDWSNNYEIITQRQNNGYNTITNDKISFGSLKQYIPKEYNWLYSTSYWNRTIFLDDGSFLNKYFVFTSGLGKICGAGFPTCAPETAIGTGIRPVVTISSRELQYLIKTETNGNGTIDVIKNAVGNQSITFKAIPKTGYKLQSIIIKTDSGKEIEFKEEELTKDKDGNLTVSNNRFTMPYENVTIYASWGIINPKTSSIAMKILLSIILIVYIGTFIYKKKRRVNI